MAVWSIAKLSELEGAKRLDAEYYRPEYLEAAEKLHQRGAGRLGDLLSDIRYGIYTEPDYVEDGTDFIRALNLEELDIQGEVLKVRPDVIASARYLLKPGDILIVRSGANVGNAGIVVDRFSGATFGSYTIRLRFKPSINPYVVYVFLKSKYGRLQTVRFRTGLAQPNINIPNLRLLQILAQFPTVEQKKIEGLVKQSHEEVIRSESVYLQGERIVLDGLGWEELDLSQPKWYTAPLSRAHEVHRLDAEHFQPKYDKLIAHLKKTGKANPLGEIATYIKRGVQPEYVEDGEVIVVNSQHLGRYLLNVEATERTDSQFWDENKRCRLQKNDVLLYSTGAHVGRTNAWLEEKKGIASNHVTIIRPNASCNPLYLAVFLNAPPGLLQTEKWASGSGQRESYPEDIARFFIYLPSEKFQQKVADLVQQSYQARQKAKALFNKAKAKVEALIEGKKNYA